VARDEVVVATKGGFIPFDGGYPTDPAGWFRTALLEPGIAAPDEVVANCHIMTPRYLEAQIEWSRRNMGLEAIDIYYVHNPETQLSSVPRAEFLVRIRAAFERLERAVAEGSIGVYGVATWDGLRVDPDDPGYLSLKELLAAATAAAGGPGHHFRAIQLPVNLFMTEACLEQNQKAGDRRATLMEAAADAGMTVMSSGSLLQGQVIRAMGSGFDGVIPQMATNAQRGLHMVRSAPGLATALVGMKSAAHVQENLATAAHLRMPGEEVLSLMRAIRRA
jgi:aryl-alcohol dehydrogenase-like predicted oxidoreductase